MARNRTPGSGGVSHRGRVTAKKQPIGTQGVEVDVDGRNVIVYFHTGLSVTGYNWHWQDAKMVAEVILEGVERARVGDGAPERPVELGSGLVIAHDVPGGRG